MNYTKVIIPMKQENIDNACGKLLTMGIECFEVEDSKEFQQYLTNPQKTWDYIDQDLVAKRLKENCIKLYLPADTDRERLLGLLMAEYGEDNLILEEMCEDDWANNWKQYYKPFRVGQKMVIKPSWEDFQAQKDDLIIDIDPGMAFGTGDHPTTFLCIQALEKVVQPRSLVADIGTGSGILAVAAALLGAAKVIGVDNDPTSVLVATENVSRNHVAERVQIVHGDLASAIMEKQDVVVANIVADVIIALTVQVAEILKDDGVFIMSGIILEREQEVVENLQKHHFIVRERFAEGSWVALIAERVFCNG